MPDPALTEAIKEAYASVPSDVVILHTLEIRHSTFSKPIRVVRNFGDEESWVNLGGAKARAVLDGLSAADRRMVGLVAALEPSARQDAGKMVSFIALAFDLDLPPVESVPVPEITVTLDNVGREITDALDEAAISQDKIEITYRPYLSTDINGPQMDPPVTMVVSEVQATPLQVTGRARMLDIGNKAFPGKLYTARDFPGLAR